MRLLFAIVCALRFLGMSADAAARPNVLFILVDDMGWGDPSCYGGAGVATPAMDRLAREGMRFTQFYEIGRAHV